MNAETPPSDVVDAARDQRLGDLVAMRKGTNPILAAVGSLVAAAVLFGVIALIAAVGEHVGLRSVEKLLRLGAAFLCVLMVACVVYAVIALVRGARSYYVWTDGFLYRRNGKIHAYRWAEIAELRTNLLTEGESAGKVRDYSLTPQGGKAIIVPPTYTDERDEFADALIAGMRRHARPVV